MNWYCKHAINSEARSGRTTLLGRSRGARSIMSGLLTPCFPNVPAGRGVRRIRPLRYFFFLLLLWAPFAAAEIMPDNQVKSAYVLNFAKFVDWPEGVVIPGGDLMLCVLGRDVFGGALFDLEGRAVKKHRIKVIRHNDASSYFGGCHLLVIGESESGRVAGILGRLGDAPVLTISGAANFAENGGAIGLTPHDNKVVFEINLATAKKARLRLPAQLLNLAHQVFWR